MQSVAKAICVLFAMSSANASELAPRTKEYERCIETAASTTIQMAEPWHEWLPPSAMLLRAFCEPLNLKTLRSISRPGKLVQSRAALLALH